MSNEEVDELLKAVETSPSGEVNYTGMLSFCFFDLGGENERGGMIVWKAWTWMGNRNSAHISKLSTDFVRTILANLQTTSIGMNDERRRYQEYE